MAGGDTRWGYNMKKTQIIEIERGAVKATSESWRDQKTQGEAQGRGNNGENLEGLWKNL